MEGKKSWLFFGSGNGSGAENPITSSDSPVNQPVALGEKISFTWNPMNRLVFASKYQMLQCIDESEQLEQTLNDISYKMRTRALKDYGFIQDDSRSADEPYFQPEERPLAHLWRYIRKTRQFEQKLKIAPEQRVFGINQVFRFNRTDNQNQYLKAILCSTISKSDLQYIEWRGLDPNITVRVPVYQSEARRRALSLCEWGPSFADSADAAAGGNTSGASDSANSSRGSAADPPEPAEPPLDLSIHPDQSRSPTTPTAPTKQPAECNVYRLIDELEARGDFARAAAIAVFNLNMKRAIDILSRSGSSSSTSTTSATTSSTSTTSTNAETQQLPAVAMALAGFTGSLNNSLWQDMCSSLRNRLKNAYLKSMFFFLTCADRDSSTTYDEILFEPQLKLSDRIAFALLYLPDQQLEKFMSRIEQSSIEAGDIEGLTLVGLTDQGLQLLQRYIDRTCDIQTVSLLILNALPNPLCDSEQSRCWVSNYKEFLDRQRLWQLTAKFNIRWHRAVAAGSSLLAGLSPGTSSGGGGANGGPNSPTAQLLPAEQVPLQVYVNCTFCGNNISTFLQQLMLGCVNAAAAASGSGSSGGGGRAGSGSSDPQRKNAIAGPGPGRIDQQMLRRPEFAAVAAAAGQHGGRVSVSAACQKTRIQACPNCRKPLPRCSLCSTHLGTAASALYYRPANQQQEDKLNARILADGNRKLSPFGNWFSWCQTCRHGGHAAHMLEWFSRNVECPVSGCTCKCMSIDSAAKMRIEG